MMQERTIITGSNQWERLEDGGRVRIYGEDPTDEFKGRNKSIQHELLDEISNGSSEYTR